MKLISVLIMVHLAGAISAAAQKGNLILTKEQNTRWFDSLLKYPLNQQLEKISQRLLEDTNVFLRPLYNDRIHADKMQNNKLYTEGTPAVFISGTNVYISNNTSPGKLLIFTKMLTLKYIKNILVLYPDNSATQAIFGSDSKHGVVVMYLTRKKYRKKFEEIMKNTNKKP